MIVIKRPSKCATARMMRLAADEEGAGDAEG
jgi:hypothetical protein